MANMNIWKLQYDSSTTFSPKDISSKKMGKKVYGLENGKRGIIGDFIGRMERRWFCMIE